MKQVEKYYGKYLFSNSEIKKRVSAKTFANFVLAQNDQHRLNEAELKEIATAMKQWALESEATHFTHWFQPMTGGTAEKHDSFVNNLTSNKVRTKKLHVDFSWKELVKGEPDASSFPNGGLRETSQARGYTIWDYKSPAFIREVGKSIILYIPATFHSYNGLSLDKKGPLLKSLTILSNSVTNLYNLINDDQVTSATTVAGVEQEYFLVRKKYFDARNDLLFTGKTLFGSQPSKTQELDDHYFGSIKENVLAFMTDLNEELWKLGIAAKNQHNEVAPNQHEVAAIFNKVNVANDQNLVLMDVAKKLAHKHDLECLFDEKPFAKVNGSGKHNNWSIILDNGQNIFEPGDKPEENLTFLIFVAALIRAVDLHADLLRLSANTYSNTFRLGGHEAPPAIISMFISEEISVAYDHYINKTTKEEQKIVRFTDEKFEDFKIDVSDRNRTSPLAFVSNKFEFRMLGSSQTVITANLVLNTIFAESIDFIYDQIKDADDINQTAHKVISDIIAKHNRIIFNGDGYSSEWREEAKRRGLYMNDNPASISDALASEKAVALFDKCSILSKVELEAMVMIYKDQFKNQNLIDAKIMVSMTKKLFIPAVSDYLGNLATDYANIVKINLNNASLEQQLTLINDNLAKMINLANELEALVNELKWTYENVSENNEVILAKMNELRGVVDLLEENVSKDAWPIPSYSDIYYR